MSQVNSAITQAIEIMSAQKGNETSIATLKSIRINITSQTKSTAATVQFFADKPTDENATLATVNINNEYDPENYIPNIVSVQPQADMKGAAKIFISYASNDKF